MLYEKIACLTPPYVDLLKKLISYESTYLCEKPIQMFIADTLRSLGYYPNIVLSRDDDNSMNIAVRVSGHSNGRAKSLILSAHSDIAPIDGYEQWTSNPLEGTIIGDKIYGRGAQDDKAGIVIVLLILDVIAQSGLSLAGDLIAHFVIDDESDGSGSRALVQSGFGTADGVIIVDGTWSNRIIVGHMGQLWAKIAVEGLIAPACAASRGINPVIIAMDYYNSLLVRIAQLNEQCQSKTMTDNSFFVNLGSLHAGVWAGAVPAKAEMEIQIGFNDTIVPDAMLEILHEEAHKISDRIHIEIDRLFSPAIIRKEDNAVADLMNTIIFHNSGMTPQNTIVNGHCDMRHFPCNNVVLYGPGRGGNAHAVDEYYHIDDIPIVAKNILDFIMVWCNEVICES